MQDSRFLKRVAFVNCCLPVLLLLGYALTGGMGANPVEFFLRATGMLALLFLLATLAVTPLRRLFAWQAVGKLRRMLGLFTFFYGLVHFVTYLVLDQSFDLLSICKDVVERPFITLGFAAFFFMVPLAATSTPGMIKRLGGVRWQRLHRRIYAIAVLAVLHDALLVKADLTQPILFGAVLLLLLGIRLVYASFGSSFGSRFGAAFKKAPKKDP